MKMVLGVAYEKLANRNGQTLKDFIRVSELAGINMNSDDLIVEYQTSPHRQPTCLSRGKMAIYAFCWNDK